MIRVIALALIGVLLTDVGWRLVERALLERDADAAPRLARLNDRATGLVPGADVPLGYVTPFLEPTAAVRADMQSLSFAASLDGSPLPRAWRWLIDPLVRMYNAEGWRAWVAFLLAAAWGVSVWGIFGGAIARIAAVYLCYGEKIGPWTAVRAAATTWRSTAGAVAIPAVVALLIALPLMLAGALLRTDVAAAVMAVVWLLVLLGGLALALLVIGLALGWPLMWSTVAVERTDAFDAVSRAYGYVYQRPLHLAFYVAVASLIGLLAQLAVNVLVDGSLAATDWAVSAGAGNARLQQLADPSDSGGLGQFAERQIRFWESALAWVAAGFPLAYLWPSAVGIYLLQRRHIDSTEMTEVVFDEGPPQRGAPPLATDSATGVPAVAGDPPQDDVGATTAPYPAAP